MDTSPCDAQIRVVSPNEPKMEGAICPEALHVEPHDEKIRTFRGRIGGELLIKPVGKREYLPCLLFSFDLPSLQMNWQTI